MIRLAIIFLPLGFSLGWASDVPGAEPGVIVLAIAATIAIAIVGVRLFERSAT